MRIEYIPLPSSVEAIVAVILIVALLGILLALMPRPSQAGAVRTMSESSSPRVVLVLGAGATRGGGFRAHINETDFEVPMDRNFWSTPAVQSVFTEDRYPVLHHYRDQVRGDSLEATWAYVDMLLKFCLGGVVSEERAWDRLQQSIRARASGDPAYEAKTQVGPESSRAPSIATWDLLALPRTVFGTLRETDSGKTRKALQTIITATRSRLSAVITFNYDTAVESVFGAPYYYAVYELRPNQGAKPILKLHGSLNWQNDSRSGIEFRSALDVADMNHGPDWYRQPEVIGPTQFKQAVTVDRQHCSASRHCVSSEACMASGSQSRRERSQILVAWMAAVRETDQLKPIDKAVHGTVSELPGRNESERQVTSKDASPGGRARNVGAKAA